MSLGNHREGLCIVRFDGASGGNPGPAGAGAVLYAEDGRLLFRFREGLGCQKNSSAEYRALILGLKQAIYKRFRNITVQGDSIHVINQFLGSWKISNPNLLSLCDDALQLRECFHSFNIQHIPTEYNTEVNAQANRAIYLRG
ncbi:uncharacterized protein Mb2253c-like [Medicago truncatula]|uniref:uncharacterized protein Mb2253c-like n=1 Tax=Medicago truncatula TaxID=3880 RepID=UPI00196831FC|nr:uncharacterized protein Mb2253c-like [Medicago truncatula]